VHICYSNNDLILVGAVECYIGFLRSLFLSMEKYYIVCGIIFIQNITKCHVGSHQWKNESPFRKKQFGKFITIVTLPNTQEPVSSVHINICQSTVPLSLKSDTTHKYEHEKSLIYADLPQQIASGNSQLQHCMSIVMKIRYTSISCSLQICRLVS